MIHLKCRAVGIQAKDSPGIRAGNAAFTIVESIFFGQIQCRYKSFHAMFNLSFICSSTIEKSYSTKSLIIVENSSTKVRSSSSHRAWIQCIFYLSIFSFVQFFALLFASHGIDIPYVGKFFHFFCKSAHNHFPPNIQNPPRQNHSVSPGRVYHTFIFPCFA